MIIYESKEIKISDSYFYYSDQISNISIYTEILKEFSWSKDGNNWSMWSLLTDQALTSLANDEKSFYLRIKWTLKRNDDNSVIIIEDLTLEYEPISSEVEKIDITKVIPFLEEINNTDYYKPGEMYAQIQEGMDFWVNKTMGIDCFYWTVSPTKNFIDPLFNEQNQQETTDKKWLKVIIPENIIPQDKVDFTEWGAEWEQFEIHVNKKYFESIFGKGKYPRDNDFLYLKKIGRMYYVESNYLEHKIDGVFMNYILKLKTYENSSKIKKDKETTDFLAENTLNADELNGEAVRNEIIDVTNPQQNLTKNLSHDEVRLNINPKNQVIEEAYTNNGSDLIQGFYNQDLIPRNEVLIQYKTPIFINEDSSLSFSCWVKLKNKKDSKTTIVNFSENLGDKKYKLTLSANPITMGIIEGDFVSYDTLYKVLEVASDHIVVYSKSNINSGGNLTTVESCNLFNTNALSVYIVNNNSLVFDYKGLLDIQSVNPIPEEIWVGIMLSFNNSYKFYGFYLWVVDANSTDHTTKLKNIFKKEKPLREPILLNSPVEILSSSINIANIRFFKKSVDVVYQSTALGVRFLKNASVAFIIDDCQPISKNYNIVQPILKIKKNNKNPL
jgi:hypothetical protein